MSMGPFILHLNSLSFLHKIRFPYLLRKHHQSGDIHFINKHCYTTLFLYQLRHPLHEPIHQVCRVCFQTMSFLRQKNKLQGIFINTQLCLIEFNEFLRLSLPQLPREEPIKEKRHKSLLLYGNHCYRPRILPLVIPNLTYLFLLVRGQLRFLPRRQSQNNKSLINPIYERIWILLNPGDTKFQMVHPQELPYSIGNHSLYRVCRHLPIGLGHQGLIQQVHGGPKFIQRNTPT